MVRNEQKAVSVMVLTDLEGISGVDTIEAIPTADVVERKHGSNITKNHPVDEFICSKCGIHLEEWVRVVIDEEVDDTYYREYAFKFCPECGADMRGSTNER